jgi:hypothetical protein
MVDKYMEAEASLLLGKSVSFGGRTLTVENLSEIRKGRQEWERRAAAEQGSGPTLGGLSFSVARFDGSDR